MIAFKALVGQLEKVETRTFDNGKEFALHEFLTSVLDASVYFFHFYHSWERGLGENANGLIRQYLPKGSTFDHLTMKDVRHVENLLKTRPQKMLCLLNAT